GGTGVADASLGLWARRPRRAALARSRLGVALRAARGVGGRGAGDARGTTGRLPLRRRRPPLAPRDAPRQAAPVNANDTFGLGAPRGGAPAPELTSEPGSARPEEN